MISRPWAYLAVLAVGVVWGYPPLVWWGLVAVMSVDLIRGWVHTAAQRLERTLRDPLTGSAAGDTVIEDAAGQRWLRSPTGRITQVCAHEDAEPVRRMPVPAVGVTDEIVAWWCDACKTQLPADWVPGLGPIASAYLNVEQQTRIRAAFLRGAKTRAPVWITEEWSYDPLTTESYQQIVDAGYEPVETTGLGDLTRTWVRGRPADG